MSSWGTARRQPLRHPACAAGFNPVKPKWLGDDRRRTTKRHNRACRSATRARAPRRCGRCVSVKRQFGSVGSLGCAWSWKAPVDISPSSACGHRLRGNGGDSCGAAHEWPPAQPRCWVAAAGSKAAPLTSQAIRACLALDMFKYTVLTKWSASPQRDALRTPATLSRPQARGLSRIQTHAPCLTRAPGCAVDAQQRSALAAGYAADFDVAPDILLSRHRGPAAGGPSLFGNDLCCRMKPHHAGPDTSLASDVGKSAQAEHG